VAPRFDRVGTLVVNQLRGRSSRAGEAIPVLMYHSISDDPEPGVSPYYRLATTPARFVAQMQCLRDNGYTVVDLQEALARVSSERRDARIAVVTFDDGFEDFRTHAWPALAAHGFTATVFLPTSFIGDTRRSFKGRPCLTWNEVRELYAAGIRFGSHTVTHSKLYDLSWPAIRTELVESRAALEQELAGPIRTFAYPYAFPQEDREFVSRFVGELAGAGYAAGVTTAIGRATPASNPFRIERLPVNDCDDEPLFVAKLAGSYDWVGRLQFAARQAKQWRNRRDMREVQHS
jgi:peptidoglycan/xylan/chitin deacetylase (PgdA/CDA1 family)